MRKRAWMVWMALAVLLALSSCGSSAGTAGGEIAAAGEDTALEDAPQESQQTQENQGMAAALVEAEARPLTQTEILSAYQRAVTAYSWFDLSPLPCTQEWKTVDGWLYQRVDYAGMEDLGDLRAYLRVVFSEELTERLLTRGNHPVYLDVDGVLYAAADAGREKDAEKGSVEIVVEQENAACYYVEVTVELLDSATHSNVIGVACYAFPYEYVDGSWVFTDFSLVY